VRLEVFMGLSQYASSKPWCHDRDVKCPEWTKLITRCEAGRGTQRLKVREEDNKAIRVGAIVHIASACGVLSTASSWTGFWQQLSEKMGMICYVGWSR